MFVNSNHAGNKKTKKSRTQFIIYMKSLINWYSQKHSTIETSVFGAEFVAIKVRVETMYAIQYELRMIAIAITGASYMYGDNMSVIHNTLKQESTHKRSVMQ